MIELNDISKTYGKGRFTVHALRNVSLTINSGEFIAIMGPSGSGKSTLLHVIGFLDRPDSGSYRLMGREITRLEDDELAILRNHLAGFVFQQFHLLSRASALENAELPLVYAGKRGVRQRAEETLGEVGLEKRMLHKPSELSGGEQQRVAIARSLVNEPLIILADEPTGNLDTKSEEEILSIIKRLNEQGKTIIMVTHEQEIAQYAKRIICMRDGEIVSDNVTKETSNNRLNDMDMKVADILEKGHSALGRIEFVDHLRQAFNSIITHKLRSFLSMLGILIGVGAVIAMVALGQGAREDIVERLQSLGSNLLSIRGGSARMRHVSMGAGEVTRFVFDDVKAIRKLPTIRRATSNVGGRGQAVYKNKNWNTRIDGVGYDYAEMRASMPTIGRWFTVEEERIRSKVVVMGATVVKELFGDENPIGKMVKINRLKFMVVGILPVKGSSHWRDQDDLVVIPVTTAMYRVLGKDYVDHIYAEVKDQTLMTQAEEEIKKLIIKRHRLTKGREDSFRVRNMSDIQEMIEGTVRTMTLLLGSIAAISLLVGGIGIMNIMLVSVTERTREIGLRKAIGARSHDVMTQFLIEAVVMTFSGGLMGILLGAGVGSLLSAFAGWPTKVSTFSVVLATTFSIAVGVGFGLWPARKASRLNPVEALRYE